MMKVQGRDDSHYIPGRIPHALPIRRGAPSPAVRVYIFRRNALR